MANRRSVLIGLGGLVAGGGALVGTGAFTTVTAERTVNVETAGDASAFLGLEPADRDSASGTQNEYVSQSGGTDDQTVEISLENPNNTSGANASGLNENAVTVFRNLVTVTNNGTQDVSSLTLEFTGGSGNLSGGTVDDVFSITASPSSPPVNNQSGNQSLIATSGGGAGILGSSSFYSSDLTPGQSINFGLEIDLLNSGVREIPADSSFTLQITAETSNTDSS
jgi:hypothetical protein